MAANTVNHPGEPQARRLESVYEQLTKLMVHPDAIRRLRAAGDNEWSVMQVLGHVVEMIPYWMEQGHGKEVETMPDEPVQGKGKEEMDATQWHEVKKGDTLSKIAEKYYGDPGLYTTIFEANRDRLKDPNLIKIGQKLRIP